MWVHRWIPCLFLGVAILLRATPAEPSAHMAGLLPLATYVLPGRGLPKILEGFPKPTEDDMLALAEEVENRVAFQEIGKE
jgi:hypothetical protein